MSLRIKRLIKLFYEDENEAFEYLYNAYKDEFVIHFNKENKGLNKEDIIDLFQDTIVILYRNVLEKEIIEIQNPKAYIFKIGQNLIFQKLREKKKQKNLKQNSDFLKSLVLPSFGDIDAHNADSTKLHKQIDKLGHRCKNIILAYYYKNLDFNEIAELYEYSSGNTVKSQKHKCIKQLRKLYNIEG